MEIFIKSWRTNCILPLEIISRTPKFFRIRIWHYCITDKTLLRPSSRKMLWVSSLDVNHYANNSSESLHLLYNLFIWVSAWKKEWPKINGLFCFIYTTLPSLPVCDSDINQIMRVNESVHDVMFIKRDRQAIEGGDFQSVTFTTYLSSPSLQ